MGAKLVLCDPHSVVVIGPSKLRGARVISPDIRAGMAFDHCRTMRRKENLKYRILFRSIGDIRILMQD